MEINRRASSGENHTEHLGRTVPRWSFLNGRTRCSKPVCQLTFKRKVFRLGEMCLGLWTQTVSTLRKKQIKDVPNTLHGGREGPLFRFANTDVMLVDEGAFASYCAGDHAQLFLRTRTVMERCGWQNGRANPPRVLTNVEESINQWKEKRMPRRPSTASSSENPSKNDVLVTPAGC